MEKLPDLKQLSNEAKEALIVELWQEIQKLSATLATYQPKPDSSPTKTSKNSSTPPSKGFKPNIKPSKIEGIKRQRSVGRAGGGRELHPHPDQTIIAIVKNCPQCGEKVTAAAQKLQSVYEKIELPPIRPIITRIERYGGQCACCQTKYVAPRSIRNGTRFTVWQFDSKLASHISVTLMPSATNGCRPYLEKSLDSRYPKEQSLTCWCKSKPV